MVRIHLNLSVLQYTNIFYVVGVTASSCVCHMVCFVFMVVSMRCLFMLVSKHVDADVINYVVFFFFGVTVIRCVSCS